MEVKSGYKLTEVGVIPEDWDVVPLADLCRSICDGTHFTPKYVQQGVPFYSVENVTADDFINTKFISETEHALLIKRCKPEPGDILMTRIGTLGDTRIIDWDVNASIYVSLALLKPNERVLPEYLYRYSKSSAFRNDVERRGLLNATPKKINMRDIGVVPVPAPRTLAEQGAVAEILRDVDALLDALERLITKKRDLKLAAMQQLLTGKTRLPGFTGKWEVKPLASEIADLEAGISVNSVEDVQSSLELPAILKTSAVANGTFIPSESKAITPRDLGRVKLSARADSVIISRMNTIDLVGECGYVPEDYPNLYVPDRLWMTRFNAGSRISAKWLAFVLSTPMSRRLLRGIATGTSGSMKNIGKGQFLGLEFAFPRPEEQEAIAGVLTEMDAELTGLQQRLAKTRDLKQAMMQELLTGKTRLLSPQEAHA